MQISGSSDVVIIGAGINGTFSAYLLTLLNPKLKISLIDAGSRPKFNLRLETGPVGATFGQSQNARHITGSEGLSLHAWEEWQTIKAADLSPREQAWLNECKALYSQETTQPNAYDRLHTSLNFAGLELWNLFARFASELNHCRISNKNVYVLFETDDELAVDLYNESRFDPRQESEPSRVELKKIDMVSADLAEWFNTDAISQNCLQVAGSTWRIQSLTTQLLQNLEFNPQVNCIWNNAVNSAADLPKARHYIWSAGTTVNIPEIYQQHSRVQGIGGFWLNLPCRLPLSPFKIRAPQPSGYINFTPDGDQLFVSGGFGWVGERSFTEAHQLLKPTREKFLKHLAHFLKISPEKLNRYVVGTCIRPSTPTGLPDICTVSHKDCLHTMISGSTKAGTTHAPLLALYCAKYLGLDREVTKFLLKNEIDAESSNIIEQGFASLKKIARARAERQLRLPAGWQVNS